MSEIKIPVGETITEQLLFKIRLMTGARVIRLVPPYGLVTHDYVPDRLTIHITEDKKIYGKARWG